MGMEAGIDAGSSKLESGSLMVGDIVFIQNQYDNSFDFQNSQNSLNSLNFIPASSIDFAFTRIQDRFLFYPVSSIQNLPLQTQSTIMADLFP